MKIFVLEDDQQRITRFQKELMDEGKHELTLAKSVEEGVKKFSPPYDLMLLDHDLGGRQYVNSEDEDTGYTFLQQLPVKKAVKGTVVIVHSYNYEGAQRMVTSAERDGARSVMRIPFGEALFTWVRRIAQVWERSEEPKKEVASEDAAR